MERNYDSGTPIDFLISDCMEHSEITSHKKKEMMSASMFPMCSIMLFLQLLHQENSGNFWRQSNMLLELFAAAGIEMHSKIQYALGFSGRQFGHYHCQNYKCKEGYLNPGQFRPKQDDPRLHTFTTDNICPHCGKGMAYVEIELKTKDIVMYIDSILVNPDDTATLLDLKSCTSNNAYKLKPSELVKSNNIAQLSSYCVEFEKQFKVHVKSYGLVYIPRDNPKGFKIYYRDFDDVEAARANKAYKWEKKKWNIAKTAASSADFELAIEGRLCKNPNEHDKHHPYDPCPLSAVCFQQINLHRVLRDFIVLSEKHKDKDFFTVLNMALKTPAPKERDKFRTKQPKQRARHIDL